MVMAFKYEARTVTPHQIDRARHALGLRTTPLISHRNHFCTGPMCWDVGRDHFTRPAALAPFWLEPRQRSAMVRGGPLRPFEQ